MQAVRHPVGRNAMQHKEHRFVIRNAQAGEREALRTVTLAAYEQYAAVMGNTLWQHYRRVLLSTLDRPGPAQPIVAARDGSIVGSVLPLPPCSLAHEGVIAHIDWPAPR